MKCLKEPLSRLANRQDKARGAFFEGRFKSVAILDDESLLATCAYIDLNLVAAGIAVVPEASSHTSVTTRVEHANAQGRAGDLKAAEHGSVAGSNSSAGLEESIWLCPIEDRHKLNSSREGMLEGFSFRQTWADAWRDSGSRVVGGGLRDSGSWVTTCCQRSIGLSGGRVACWSRQACTQHAVSVKSGLFRRAMFRLLRST
jgi:hypothetical protein